MKKTVNYIFIILLITGVIAGCTKNVAPAPTNSLTIPTGNFMGNLTLIHLNTRNNTLDTSIAAITLAMPPGGTYSVGGDTSKIQAGSYGTYNADGTNITFFDATVTKRTNLNVPKKHLNGLFLYNFDGTNLRIYGSSDTLSFNYTLQSY